MKTILNTTRTLQSLTAKILLIAFTSGAAFAQYPGGGAAPSYGNKGAVIGGVAAGAAVGVGLIYWKTRSHAKLQGCVAGDGDKLVSEKDKQTYSLTNKQNQSLKPGARVELVGKKTRNAAGERIFEVQKMSKDLGQCTVAETAQLTTQK